MKLGVLRETVQGERRVALTPTSVAAMQKIGFEVFVESNAGDHAGFTDEQYRDKGAKIVDRAAVLSSDVVVCVRAAGANRHGDQSYKDGLRTGQLLIGSCDPLGEPAAVGQIATTGVTLFGLELIPRITRAQSMDVLSSQATIAGYRAVLLAAIESRKMFPMMMTAAGTLTAAKVLIIGAGVAGLQAIATAKRLGGVVSAYDVRPATREQIESLGGKFVELKLDAGSSEDKGGYAKAMDEAFYQRQRELMADVVATQDVVICTAAIPGKRSPLLVTADAVRRMAPGSVIVDLAAERGGNCELTKPDTRHVEYGVTILGPTNISSDVPQDASIMLSNNFTKFMQNMVKDKELRLNLDDEIIKETMLTQNGQVMNDRVRGLLSTAS